MAQKEGARPSSRLPGRGLSNLQTRNSPSTVYQCEHGGGRTRMEPASGAQLPGRGLSNTRTRNSPKSRA